MPRSAPLGTRLVLAQTAPMTCKGIVSKIMDLGVVARKTLEIATRARVSKRELYALFGSKQAILRACIALRASRMLPAEPPPPASDLQTFSAMLTAYGARLLVEVSHPGVLAVHRLAGPGRTFATDFAVRTGGAGGASRQASGSRRCFRRRSHRASTPRRSGAQIARQFMQRRYAWTS